MPNLVYTCNIIWDRANGFAVSRRSLADGTQFESSEELARRLNRPEPEGVQREFRAEFDDEGHVVIISPYLLTEDEQIAIVDLLTAKGFLAATSAYVPTATAVHLDFHTSTTTTTTTTSTTTT